MFKTLRILFTILSALCFVILPFAWYFYSFEAGITVVAIAALFFILMLICKNKQEEDGE